MRLRLRKREFILKVTFSLPVAVVVVAKALYCLLRNVLTVPSCSAAGGIVMYEVILRSDQRCNIFKRENERTRSLFLSTDNKL